MKKPLSKNTHSSSSSASSASQTAALIKKLLNDGRNDTNVVAATAITEHTDAARLDELRRIFSKLQSTSELCLVQGATANSNVSANASANTAVQQKWNTWLKKQHLTFMSQLMKAVQGGRKSSLRTFMGVIASSPIIDDVRGEENGKKNNERMNSALVQKLLYALIQPDEDNNDNDNENNDPIVAEYMLEMLDVEFISKYRDIQYYILVNIKHIAQQLYGRIDGSGNDCSGSGDETIGIYAENLLRILLKIDLAADQSELNPVDLKESDGTCSNYLFLPPNYHVCDDNASESDDGGDFDNTDKSVDGEGEGDNDNNQEEGGDEGGKKDDHDDDNVDVGSRLERKAKVKIPPMQSIRQHQSALQDATLAILKIPTLPPRALKLVLQHLPSKILPNTTNPLRFADFCTKAFDMGGVTSLLALNSLFILMTQCGLEYKQFYPSLYNLVEPKVFYVKYRTRFFKLLVKCLTANQMLPAYLVAAFCKKLCRCALSAPPSGALFVLALVSNLLRKHEECACIIHRTGGTEKKRKAGGGELVDVYDLDQRDPVKSKAIESSLWELNALERHYHPAVSSMAKGLGMEDSKMLMHNLDEFLLHTYKSLFEQERKRAGNKRRSKVPLTFHEPKGLFKEEDVFDGIFDFPNKKQK